MTVTTTTRAAKCKDCIWLHESYVGKMKRHKCENIHSKHKGDYRTKNDLVCDVWKLF